MHRCGSGCLHQPVTERQKVDPFASALHVLPVDRDAAEHTARHLERQGQMIGPYDLMLAGQALSLGVTLITHNTDEFQRVPGLALADWQSPEAPPTVP